MKNDFKIDIDAKKILKQRGLNANGAAQKFFTECFLNYLDDYIPKDTGKLRAQHKLTSKGIVISSPYARFQYYGKVMVGVKSGSPWARRGEKKKVIDRSLRYKGAPKRGAFWDKRMWSNESGTILKQVKRFIEERGRGY